MICQTGVLFCGSPGMLDHLMVAQNRILKIPQFKTRNGDVNSLQYHRSYVILLQVHRFYVYHCIKFKAAVKIGSACCGDLLSI